MRSIYTFALNKDFVFHTKIFRVVFHSIFKIRFKLIKNSANFFFSKKSDIFYTDVKLNVKISTIKIRALIKGSYDSNSSSKQVLIQIQKLFRSLLNF